MAGPNSSDATLRRRPFGTAATLGLIALSALLLAGCSSDNQKGLCPSANILVPASTLTVFRQNAPADPSGELYTVWMSNAKTGCDFDKHDLSTDSRIHILFKATRAPSDQGGTYKVPYFVAVTHKGSRIMTKKLFVASIVFAPGETKTAFEDTVDSTVIHVGRGNKIGEYEIVMGFQLTEAQLDYNVKNNHFAGP
ncbi:MAG: hypothetical protein JOZ72_00245 [Alphaproteobacteria bacterium]|nr:hypothetical protein [Alphaproteobacteria bacterium]